MVQIYQPTSRSIALFQLYREGHCEHMNGALPIAMDVSQRPSDPVKAAARSLPTPREKSSKRKAAAFVIER
jgi:hypothetical protein